LTGPLEVEDTSIPTPLPSPVSSVLVALGLKEKQNRQIKLTNFKEVDEELYMQIDTYLASSDEDALRLCVVFLGAMGWLLAESPSVQEPPPPAPDSSMSTDGEL